VVPLQVLSARQLTQTRGLAVVRQNGVAPEQPLLSAHWSMVTVVGGVPCPVPLPSET
jgi:hypothetical protein